jgi:hypothetical protein
VDFSVRDGSPFSCTTYLSGITISKPYLTHFRQHPQQQGAPSAANVRRVALQRASPTNLTPWNTPWRSSHGRRDGRRGGFFQKQYSSCIRGMQWALRARRSWSLVAIYGALYWWLLRMHTPRSIAPGLSASNMHRRKLLLIWRNPGL